MSLVRVQYLARLATKRKWLSLSRRKEAKHNEEIFQEHAEA
jgi:hypothetical protein